MQLITEPATPTGDSGRSVSSATVDRFHPPKPKISAFNGLFMCHLCQGYMINPTTIDVCMHTYCRSCIGRHLTADNYCPQCKGQGGKALTISNLKSDDILRSIIFKLVPGLYQKERERVVQFVNNTKSEGQSKASSSSSYSKDEYLDSDDDIFSPVDPISISLEYHPFLARQCEDDAIPPVRYLQCPASVKIQHLKRFLCSKFDIDPCNKKIAIEIIYEDEVLPSDFTLMDVCYCYNWKRHAPLKFFYRILIYSEEQCNKSDNQNTSIDKVSENSSETYLGKVTDSAEPKLPHENTSISLNGDVRAEKSSQFLPPPLTTKVKSSKSSSNSKHHSKHVTIAPKPTEAKKSVSKKSSPAEDFVLPTTNDFKSLRSNDIRYSPYVVTSSTIGDTSAASSSLTEQKTKVKEEKPAKCDIVVSIPHNQMQDEWDSKPLSQLKTASKKSPNPHPTPASSTISNEASSSTHTKKVKNVPKLKIELNSLRTKLIEKPKSADIRLDSLIIKHHRPRKYSLDEKPATNKVDLETYAKNIGLKPIEIQTMSAVAEPEVSEKFTPNASPRSSCSSSTTSSSNGHLNVVGDISKSSSSSHKKRKKKHSKDSKEPRDSKRKKMHAEISSRGADESLKMKVKLTAPLSIKPSKLESKKSPSAEKISDPLALVGASKSLPTTPVLSFEKPTLTIIKPKDVAKDKSSFAKEKDKSSIEKKFKDTLKLKPLAIKTCAKEFEDDDDDIIIPDTTSSLSLSKPLTNLKDDKLPHSPPLPPSLFKTTPIPLPFKSFTTSNNAPLKPKPMVQPKQNKDKYIPTTKMKPLAPKPMSVKSIQSSLKAPQFAIPNPPRLMANNATKFISSTPTSIASSANKQMGNLLKRSVSLDESKAKVAASMAKQPKLDRPHQITVSAYGSNLQVTKFDVPATPTSSTAKATFDIPLYSPQSASYNPKCSFSVSSATTKSKASNPNLSLTIISNSGCAASSKPQVFSNSVAAKSSDADAVKKTSPSTNFSGHSLMGPPLPLPKLGTVVPTAVKSPPLGSVLPLNCSKSYALNSCQNSAIGTRPILAQAKSSTLYTEHRQEMATTAATNGSLAADKQKSSLRQFRLPSRESGQDILDLSSTVPKSNATTTTTTNGIQGSEKKSISIAVCPSTTAGTSLELALPKIKQNLTSGSNQDNLVGGMEIKPNSDDLQNLHLLSESATAREKIAISSMPSTTLSLYEKPNTLVRQQNASVRSIPNPSALAYRNHPPAEIPMVRIEAPLFSNHSNDVDKPILSVKQTPLPHTPLSPNCSTSTSPPRSGMGHLLTSKKHPSIDQVAASLNMRATAAAAAEATAKANLKQLDESAALVTSTSTSTSIATEAGGANKLKQIKQETPEQSLTSPAPSLPSSSTTSSAASSSPGVVEIKQEPEEKFHEEQRGDVRPPHLMPMVAMTTTMTTTPSKVENLVTSVINVSTPTSTLLTTNSAAF